MRLKKTARLVLAPLLYLTLLAGQTPAAPAPGGPTFDVVSIKINNSGDNGGAWGSRCESGRWSGRNIPVSAIIVTAFGLMQAQVAGIPDWDRRPLHQFDITATCPADAVATQIRPMLQAMLANRFHFAGHWETRDLAVRTLEVAKTGVHLQPPSGACVAAAPEAPMPQGEHLCGRFYATRTPLPGPRVDGEPITIRYQAWSASTADFIAYFGRMGRIGQPPMVDETGLTGKYDFDFAYEVIWNAKDDAGHPIDQSYKFDQGLEKRVGLIYNETKLKKKPMPFLVIDHIEMPTPN